MAVSFDTVLKLNLLSPATLDAMEIIPTTRYSKNKNFRNPTHIKCPLCGSLEMTPKFDRGRATQWFCSCYGHGNRSLTNLELFMKINDIDDRDEAARRFCEIAHIEFKTEDDDSDAPKQLSPEEIKTLILDEIDIAKTSFDKLPDIDKRGFAVEDFQRVDIGIDLHWTHPKMPNTPETPRFIVPLGDKGNYVSYNAILTPEGRKKFKAVRESKNPPKWSDKCLTAGAKLVFNPPALEEKIVPTTEGEFDALAIMKAYEYRTLACALGGAGQWRDLCSRLEKRPTKPFVLLIKDEDDGGDTGMNNVAQHLAEIRVPAVVRSLEQYMTPEDIAKVGGKVDANALMQTLGLKFLRNLMTEIIVDVDDELNALADKYAVAEKTKPDELPFEPRSAKKKSSTSSETKRPEIQALLDKINAEITCEQLEKHNILTHSANGKPRPEGYCCPWCGSGTHTKQTGSFQFYPYGGGVYCHACSEGGNVFQLINHVRNEDASGQNFFVQLRRIADEFGVDYDPTIFDPPESKIELSPLELKLKDWQEINGQISDELVPKIQAAVDLLGNVTTENITAADAQSSKFKFAAAMCRFYDFNDVADNFILTLETAKSNAADQIKTAKIAGGEFVAQPDEKIRALSVLPLSNIKAAINSFVSDIKRNHRKYQEAVAVARRREIAQKKLKARDDEQKITIDKSEVDYLFSLGITDADNAERAIFLAGDKIRYLPELEQWLVYDSKRGLWRRGNKKSNTIIMPVARDIARILNDNMPSPETYPDAAAVVDNWRSTKKTNLAFTYLKSHDSILIKREDLDAHKNLINCLNGVLDLQTGIFYKRQDENAQWLLTRQLNAIFKPNFRSEVVEAFFKSLFDEETLTGLLSFLGYCLTGETNQHKAHFWKGDGSNGKSTLLNWLLLFFGTYGAKLGKDTFCDNGRPADANAATAALNMIVGARFAGVNEFKKKDILKVDLFKDITGSDMLYLRELNQEAFNTIPTAKFVFNSNFAPRLDNVDDRGLTRRILVVEFKNTFSEELGNIDKQLPAKLADDDAMSALLSILLFYAKKFYETDRLIESPRMKTARNTYFNKNDFILEFVEEYCVVGKQYSVSSKELLRILHDKYKFQASSFSNKELREMLQQKIGGVSCYTDKHKDIKVFSGIALANEPNVGDDDNQTDTESLENPPF